MYTLKVCVRSLTEDGRDLIVNGQLNLVDLAGPSALVGRARRTSAREAGSIKRPLLTLGRVITALKCGRVAYVPYETANSQYSKIA